MRSSAVRRRLQKRNTASEDLGCKRSIVRLEQDDGGLKKARTAAAPLAVTEAPARGLPLTETVTGSYKAMHIILLGGGPGVGACGAASIPKFPTVR